MSHNSSEGGLILEFEETMDNYYKYYHSHEETLTNFIDSVEQTQELLVEHRQLTEKCDQIQSTIDTKSSEHSNLEQQLLIARKLVESEKRQLEALENKRNELKSVMNLIYECFNNNATSDPSSVEELRHKLAFLNNNNFLGDKTKDMNTTDAIFSDLESVLSDFSYSKSENELDAVNLKSGNAWKKHRPSAEGIATPKRISSENRTVEIGELDIIRATTTLCICQNGTIEATSTIESVPRASGCDEIYVKVTPASPESESICSSKTNKQQTYREHDFKEKTVVMPENCASCKKRIGFGKTALKCKECKAVYHLECNKKLPLPCIPKINTPTEENDLGNLEDYTWTTSPMVPDLLIQCIEEIELRMTDFSAVELYETSEPGPEVKNLTKKFVKGKTLPRLKNFDLKIVCGVVKHFLGNLPEPLVTCALQKKIIEACDNSEVSDIKQALFEIISELPQPNRDTMAYIMLHLQKVDKFRKDGEDLAKIFAPIIVGCFAEEFPGEQLLQILVVKHLLNLPSDYWATIVGGKKHYQSPKPRRMSSTSEFLRYLTNRRCNKEEMKEKYFPLPGFF